MKKIFALGWMLVAALALTNCSKEETVTPEVEGQAFELFASTNGTRTTMADLKTSWKDEDAMNVWTANGDSYLDHGTFTISDVENGKFTGTLNTEFDPTTANDWYAIYPYKENLMPTGNDANDIWMYVGHSSPYQNGNNSQAHLSKTAAPLYGVAKAVAGSETPVFQMHHLSTFVRVRVTNNTANPFTVASVYMTSENELNLAGSYYIDITGSEVVYTPSLPKTEVKLTVNNGEEIAVGDQAEFYLPLAPIQFGEADEMLTVDITTTEGATISVEKTIPAGTKFAAGVMNTLKVEATEDNIEYPAPSIDYTGANFELVTDASTLQAGDAIIIAAAEADMAMLAAQDTNNRKAGAVTKSGNYIIHPDATIQVFTLEGSTGAWEFNTGNGYIYAASSESNHLKTQTNNDDNGKWNIIVDSAGTQITAIGSNSRKTMQYNTASALFSCYTSASQAPVALYKYTDVVLTPLATPVVTATVQNQNEIVVSWNAVENAGSYKITCGDQNATVEGETTYTFTNLGYNTEYIISVMAIPTDATQYIPSTGTATATTGENLNVASGTAVYDFTAISGFSSWGSSYSKRTVTYAEGDVIFTSANKQSGTITNMPVTKGQPVEFKLTNGATLTKAELVCKQWGTKAQTITMHYSTNGGSTYTSTGVQSSNFTISNDALPAGTNAIKFTFSSTSNQIGIQSLEIAYE